MIVEDAVAVLSALLPFRYRPVVTAVRNPLSPRVAAVQAKRERRAARRLAVRS